MTAHSTLPRRALPHSHASHAFAMAASAIGHTQGMAGQGRAEQSRAEQSRVGQKRRRTGGETAPRQRQSCLVYIVSGERLGCAVCVCIVGR